MNQEQTSNFWLFLEVLAKRRNLIIVIVTLVTLGSIGTALLLPKWYKSEALLLPPKNITTALVGSSRFSEAFSITSGLNLPVLTTPNDLYARMLKSRTVTKKVIDQFNLQKHYKTRNFDETYDAFMYYTKIRVTAEGLLSVSVEDRNPQMAADMTNALIDALDEVNREIITDRINQTKKFIASRLAQVRTDLDSARFALQSFQMKYKAVDFDEQTKLAIEQAAQLKIKLAELELNLQMSKISLGANNAELVNLQRQKKIIKKQLIQLETSNPDSSFFSLPVALIPSLKGEYEQLFSRVKVGEALYQVLLEQREQAKMKEFEKMPTLSVLDRAEVPEVKSRPKRTLIVVASAAGSFFFAVFLALILEYFRKLEDNYPDDYKRAIHFLSAYFGWLPGVKKKN